MFKVYHNGVLFAVVDLETCKSPSYGCTKCVYCVKQYIKRKNK